MDARAYYEGVISSVQQLIAEEYNIGSAPIELLGRKIANKIADSELLRGENEYGNTGLILAASWAFTKHVRFIPEKHPINVRINRSLNKIIPEHIFLNLLLILFAQPNHNINAANNDGDTALICAARAGNISFVRALLRFNADPALKNKKGETAEQVTNKFIIRKLLQSETLEKKLANFQRLREVVAKQTIEDIKEEEKYYQHLNPLMNHANLHMKNLQTLSFHSAINNLDFILEHLDKIQDFSFLPSLITHFSSLLKNHVVIAGDIKPQETSLAAQVADEGAAIAKYIDAKYKEPDSENKEEHQPTPGTESAIGEHIPALLKSSFQLAGSVLQVFRGSDSISFNNFENAILNGDEEIVLQYLEENELSPDIIINKEYSKSTPLMLSASCGKVELVKLFLDLGANPILKDSWGKIAEDRADTEEIRLLLHNIPEYMLLTFQKKRTLSVETSNSKNPEEYFAALLSLTVRSAISDLDFILKRHDVNHALFPELIMRMANLFASLPDSDKRFDKYSHNLLKVAAHFGHGVAKHIVASYTDPEHEPKKERIRSTKLKSLFKLFSTADSDFLIARSQIDEDRCGERIDKVKKLTQ